MNAKVYSLIVGGVVILAGAAGCQQNSSSSGAPAAAPAASSQEAITTAAAKATPQEKTDYLVAQANAFLNSKNYQEAINTAKYILSDVDQNSAKAQDILKKATVQLEQVAQQKLNEVKASADKALSDVTGKLESLGK